MKKKRLGEILIERGTVAAADIDQALVLQRQKNIRLGEILVQNLHVSRTAIATALEQMGGVAYAECPPGSIAPEVLALLPRATAVKHCVLPLEIKGSSLVVAMAEPQDLTIIEQLRSSTGRPITPRFSFRQDIQHGIRKFYDAEDLSKTLVLKDIEFSTQEEPLQTNAEEEETLTQLEFIVANSREENKEALKELRAGSRKRNYAIRLLSIILSRAAQQEASDLHLEPGIDSTVIRLRVDGVLQDLMKVPQAQQAVVVQRIKNLADMESGPHRVPQEGRFLIIHKGRRLDIRVSTLPTHFGEKILIRVLDPRSTLRSFEQLGMARRHENALKRILSMPEGMLIVTGPTGSGKSTTLYSALNAIASPHRSIVAIEDPVEYMLEGITQVQLNPASGLNLAAMLQPILRQHPDVIMIGELLDEETAETALRAAQIGHLVLTSLHTYDSIDAITRLRSFMVPTNLISSIQGIVAQNLVRTLCDCRTELEPTEHFRASLRKLGHSEPVNTMYQPSGCYSCAGTGYHGRAGVFELLLIEGAIRDALQREVSIEEIRRMLPETGFRSMQQDALDKVVQGQTTLDEVLHAFPLVV